VLLAPRRPRRAGGAPWACSRAKGTSNLKRKGVGSEMKVLDERKRWPLLWKPAPRSAPPLCHAISVMCSTVKYNILHNRTVG